MAKQPKKGAKKAVTLRSKKLSELDAHAVKGGRKSGKGQQDFLIVKMKEA